MRVLTLKTAHTAIAHIYSVEPVFIFRPIDQVRDTDGSVGQTSQRDRWVSGTDESVGRTGQRDRRVSGTERETVSERQTGRRARQTGQRDRWVSGSNRQTGKQDRWVRETDGSELSSHVYTRNSSLMKNLALVTWGSSSASGTAGYTYRTCVHIYVDLRVFVHVRVFVCTCTFTRYLVVIVFREIILQFGFSSQNLVSKHILFVQEQDD